jgi:glycosyltransferase involved in cell wall biosynthesis
MRVALLTNILTPYRMPALRALAQTPGWTLRVFVNAEREFDRTWELDAGGIDVEQIPGTERIRRGTTLHIPSPVRFFAALRSFRPDAVISSELGPRTLLAWLFCLSFRLPFTIWAEPTRGLLAQVGRIRRLIGRFLLSRAGSVIVPGAEARRAFLTWGLEEERLFVAPNCHDTETYEKELARIDPVAVRPSLHARLGCRTRIALVVGRLLYWKGTSHLLAAWDWLPPVLRSEWTLLFVGDGPEASRVERALRAHLRGEIAHIRHASPRELAELYSAADLLIHPTLGEPWGVVVNEAMACELPVLCSLHAGCAEDLVAPGETGWLANPLDETGFREGLLEAMTSGERERLGELARARIARFDAKGMAEGFRVAVLKAVIAEDGGPGQPTVSYSA